MLHRLHIKLGLSAMLTSTTVLKMLPFSKSKKKYNVFAENVFTFARSNNVLLFVEVVLVALDVAAATLQGRRRLEDVPQRLGTGLAVGGEVIQRGDELVAFVWETVGFVALRDRLHVRLLPALSLVGIQNLNAEGRELGRVKKNKKTGQ